MPDLDLDHLQALADAATPGPWRQHDTYLNVGGYTATVLSGEFPNSNLRAWLPSRSNEPWDETRNVWNDAAFIAAARTAVPDLIAEVRRLTGDSEWLLRRIAVQEKFLACYRAGTRPSERLLDEMKRTREYLAARKEADGG